MAEKTDKNLKIVLATANPHKVEEINAICEGLGVEFILPSKGFNPTEDGSTFLENAYKKAIAAIGQDLPVLADDSGLCVDALYGAPGLYSARYANTQGEKIDKLLNALEGVQDRSAKFVCAMVLLDEYGNKLFETVGECSGKIATERFGANGFGYDPVFIVDGGDLTMAQLSENEKNKISHRARALQNVMNYLKNNKIYN